MSTDSQDISGANPADGAADGAPKGTGGALSLMLPPDQAVWNEARKLAADKSIRVEDLATCCIQDPVIVLDLLRTSNAMFFAGGKSNITSIKTAIVRLGSDVVIETLEKMSERPQIEEEEVLFWFELHRSRCRRTAIVSRILSEALARTLTDDCQAAALLLSVGDMLAVAHFGQKYVELAEELSKSGLNYRLAQDYRFDVEKMGVSYLRKYGIPEALLFAIERDGRARSQERVLIKPIIWASLELVEAFDSNRWEKFAPGKTLSSKSSLRMLQIPDNQYLKIYERCSEYLFAARLQEERKKHGATAVQAVISPEPEAVSVDSTNESDSLQDDIQNLLKGGVPEEVDSAEATREEAEIPPISSAPPTNPTAPEPAPSDDFAITKSPTTSLKPARTTVPRPKDPQPEPLTSAAKEIMQSMSGLMDEAKSGEELLSQLLDMLVKSGKFEKSALIVVSKDRKKAKVVAARGPNIGNGQTLIIDDPLSPLARCFSKVKSWGSRESKDSPWGSKAFAVAPIDAAHDTPVALYADCGTDGAITFEARRIFRTVVQALNQRLPEIPGGIPIEI
jgi:HD-like signal output (HDOD) protein